MLYAFFDETGTHSKSRITAIAGFVGSKTQWDDIEDKWHAVLSDFVDKGVCTFHMTDCAAQTGEFAGIDTPSRNYIITQLSKALGNVGVQAISSAVVIEDWSIAVTDPVFLARFPRPFDLCFDDLIRQLWEWATKYADGEIIAPMFAHQPEYLKRMVNAGAAYGAEKWYQKIFDPIAFGCPVQVVPLQSADLISHQIGWSIEHRRFGQISIANSGQTIALENAINGRFMHGHWFDADGLARTIKCFRETGEICPLESLG